jgi:isoleucyl-tRNA synthetase
LTRWLAPILSFTAEEIWQAIPGNAGESIFVEQWYTQWPEIHSIDMAEWQQLQLIRDEVNKALENQRQAGVIGSALAAEIIIYASKNVASLLAKLGDELRFLMITSAAELRAIEQRPEDVVLNEELGVAIHVSPSHYEKCARCWHRCEDVGQHSEHPLLCQRCVINISGKGEERQFV